jgi:hypothetical protein
LIAFRNVTPPPGTIPSSTAARVADRASSIRCFFSFISVSHTHDSAGRKESSADIAE